MKNSLIRKLAGKLAARAGYLMLSHSFRLPGEELIAEWVEKARLRNLLEKFNINCIFDVGANVGGYARMLRKLGFRGHIFSYEPNPADFVLLSEAFRADQLWKGFNFALGCEDRRGVFNIANNSVLSSFLRPKEAAIFFNKIQISNEIQVDVKRLDSVFDGLLKPIQNPRVFLKIDTQGYDLEVVKGAARCIDRIIALQSEISVEPIYESMPHYLEALSYYESLGFKLMDLSIVNRAPHGGILEYDCIMARVNGITK